MCGKGIRQWLVLVGVLATTGLAVPVASARSSGGLLGGLLPSCGATTNPFKAWGDPAAYCAFPNLGFESGATTWALSSKASIVAGNEPWHVSGSGTHALQLAPGATAQSGTLRVNLFDPWVRLFAHSSGANGSLRVQVVFRGLLGNLTGLLNVGTLSPGGYANWQPTQRVLSSLALPLLTTSAQVLLTSTATSGSWQVDDLYLDPCASKLG
jgi:hypothetical protein